MSFLDWFVLGLSIWVVTGIYGGLSNEERLRRFYAPMVLDKPPGLDEQSFITLLLGPLGLWLVITHGGRWLFWRKP